MANINKVQTPIAVEHKSKLDLSFDHVTTMGFMRLQPVAYRHMQKTEHLSMIAESSVRPAPIEVPFFGKLVQNLRAFFVPYRLVFPQWEAFKNDVIGNNIDESTLVDRPPIIPNVELVKLFFTGYSTYHLSSVVTTGRYDYEINGVKYRLNVTGRRWLYVLESLGYKIIPQLPKSGETDEFYNGLALLAYAKLYIDWYANSQYLNSADVLSIERYLAYNDPSTNLVLYAGTLYKIFALTSYNVYDVDDYFVNAWDNPVSPNNGQYTGFSFVDPTSSGGAFVQSTVNGTPEMVSSTAYPQSIGTTYIHEALKRLTDYQKRHALAGARSIDRVLAQYGIVTDSLKQQRSIYVGSQQIVVETGAVMATANGKNDSTGINSSVGDYAGAGFGKGSKQWDFTTDEEGIFIVVATINPLGTVVQGYDRQNTIIDKLSFFQPELDSLGVQAIERGEVYVPDNDDIHTAINQYKGVFGFTGRYGHLKRPKSFLTGDFRLPTFFTGGNAWHLFRLFDNARFGDDIDNVVHSLSFTRSEDASQYNRIFQETSGEYDPFFCFMHFAMVSYMPCKPLFETYEFESESKTVTLENGNKVN